MAEQWVAIARLGRARGLKGEVYADGWSVPERYRPPFEVRLRRPGGQLANEGSPLVVANLKPYKGRVIVRFEGIESAAAARPLAGHEVVVPAGARAPPGAGEFYLSDLVGCDVVLAAGRRVGAVTGWREFGGPELLEIRPDGAGPDDVIWIPFARTVCVDIDLRGRRIVIDPPEGLLELNKQDGVAE
jgi:16S rRNA processing protein RimM